MYRTKLTLTVLSEEPIPEMELSTLIRECEEGEYVLAATDEAAEELTGKQTVSALYNAGSEPGFFCLNDDGERED